MKRAGKDDNNNLPSQQDHVSLFGKVKKKGEM
jgi:hypothetical protein